MQIFDKKTNNLLIDNIYDNYLENIEDALDMLHIMYPEINDEELVKQIEIKLTDNELNEKLRDHILNNYPQDKQNADMCDKFIYESFLQINDANFNKTLLDFYNQYKTGKTITDIIKNTDDKLKEAYTQMLKIYIRINWVLECKKLVKANLGTGKDIELPVIPEIKE